MKVACVSRWVRLVQIASCQPPFHNIVVSFVTSRAGAVKAKRGEENPPKKNGGKEGRKWRAETSFGCSTSPIGPHVRQPGTWRMGTDAGVPK